MPTTDDDGDNDQGYESVAEYLRETILTAEKVLPLIEKDVG